MVYLALKLKNVPIFPWVHSYRKKTKDSTYNAIHVDGPNAPNVSGKTTCVDVKRKEVKIRF